jgi:hypothetical protein
MDPSSNSCAIPQQSYPSTSALPAAFVKSWAKLQRVLQDGPLTEGDWIPYEIMKTARGDADAKYMKFDIIVLLPCLLERDEQLSLSPEFCADIGHLLRMLPIKDGEDIDRRLLIDLILEAAKQCGMQWCSCAQSRAVIWLGIMHACSLVRRGYFDNSDEELGTLMSKTNLGKRHQDMEDIVNMLANNLETLTGLGRR